MISFLRMAFFFLIVRPLTMFILGLNIRGVRNLPENGPAIVIANHNSHLDAIVLMSLFPLAMIPKIHPVAAQDYFLAGKALAWFSTKIIGIIPFKRKTDGERCHPFEGVEAALERGEVVIFFPEGTRGEAEQLSSMKSGIAHLAKKFPEVPITPVFLHGLGKALPKGDPILVPFMVDVVIGPVLPQCEDKAVFMQDIQQAFDTCASEI